MGTCCNKNSRDLHGDKKEENLASREQSPMSERSGKPRVFTEVDKNFFANAKMMLSSSEKINVKLISDVHYQ